METQELKVSCASHVLPTSLSDLCVSCDLILINFLNVSYLQTSVLVPTHRGGGGGYRQEGSHDRME